MSNTPDDPRSSPFQGLAGSLEDCLRLGARVITIALGVFLGLMLFVWFAGHRAENDFKQTLNPAPIATTTSPFQGQP
jgi:hypothetical protein